VRVNWENHSTRRGGGGKRNSQEQKDSIIETGNELGGNQVGGGGRLPAGWGHEKRPTGEKRKG